MSTLASYISLIDLSSANDGDLLVFNSASDGKFDLQAPGAVPTNLTDLADVAGTPNDGDVLTYSSGGMTWGPAAPSGGGGGAFGGLARALTAHLAVTGGAAAAAMAWTTVLVAATADITVTSSSRFTVVTTGTWKISINSNVSTTNYGDVYFQIWINGTNTKASRQASYGAQYLASHTEIVLSLTAGDYIEIAPYSTAGCDLSILSNTSSLPHQTVLTIELLGT